MEGLAGLKPSTSGKSKLLVLTDEGNGSFAGCPAEEGLQLVSGWTSGRNLKRLQNSVLYQPREWAIPMPISSKKKSVAESE